MLASILPTTFLSWLSFFLEMLPSKRHAYWSYSTHTC